ncbi:TRAP transporter large permease subunit [Hydrogenophaga sp.]|uniref:TRAP transporter large permease n=1 Tax=Hydrogenophaga sp. TaxID=1904254 RepID=UPI002613F615|nr:TRAP transporter large permease subunit [Hydrogenophaga sp.]MDM7949985.1 TRAP transporter large permease subunit [Hydrogenophaga sp.]
MDILLATALIVLLFIALGSGLWIGMALLAVGLVAMEFATSRPVGDSMVLTIWGSTSSWTLTALPLFLWMGEILFRTKLSEDMFKGLAPWLNRLPGRLLHVNVIGSTIFAAVSGSSAATCATIGRIALPELRERGYPESLAVGTLAGAATLGLLIPPSIIMIVYGVAADVSIAKLFIAGIVPGILLASLFMGYIVVWALLNPSKVPAAELGMSLKNKLYASRHLIPVVMLIGVVLGSIYSGVATATEAAAIGVLGSLVLATVEGSMSWKTFTSGVGAACRVYCMIGLILAGAAFLTLAMGFVGLPRHLAEFITAQNLSPFALVMALTVFYLILGCFLDGISMVVLTIGVLLPTVQAAGFDLVWFGVFTVLLVELAQITPPVGLNLFVLQGLTKHPLTYIARAAAPMFLLMLFAAMLTYFLQDLILWLPNRM